MRRGRDSVSTVVEEEKRGDSASIHASVSWAVPCPLLFPCQTLWEEWSTTYVWHPGEEQHPRLSTLNPGERAHQGGGFSWRYSCKEAALPKAVHPLVSCLRSVS